MGMFLLKDTATSPEHQRQRLVYGISVTSQAQSVGTVAEQSTGSNLKY